MNKIKAAIVGYGNIGRFVLESLQEADDFEIAGIVRRSLGAQPAELAPYKVVTDIADQPKKAAKMIAELRDEQLKSIEEKGGIRVNPDKMTVKVVREFDPNALIKE